VTGGGRVARLRREERRLPAAGQVVEAALALQQRGELLAVGGAEGAERLARARRNESLA
jgi:hypothetical protein